MSIWVDPLLPRIVVPEDLQTRTFQLGSAKFQLLPKQYEFLSANEEFIGYVGGYGSGKTRVGAIKAAHLSMWPGNRGIVGRLNATDLEDTAQRDLLDFLEEAELIKTPPNARTKTAVVYCIDLATGKSLGETSEISFQHLDDPKHLRGRHLGWGWIDEGSEVKRAAWQNLIGRLRLPAFRGKYQMLVTGNPEGHNWIYDFFFDPDNLLRITCKKPDCKLCLTDPRKCNEAMRRKRRGIHCTSYENYFLPPEYIDQMISSFSEEERQRYVEASFDVFEGQVFKEWRPEIHVFEPPSSWEDGRPPREWQRLLAVDVGGSSPWCWLWCAVDPNGNLIFYDEIYRTTTHTEELVAMALPKMKDLEGSDYTFQAKVIDYENRIAAEDIRKGGINLTNAQKHDKMVSVNRLRGYMHPNPKHHYPSWHPRAGQPGSPRMFVTSNCGHGIKEIPQQRYKEKATYFSESEKLQDELDRGVPNHWTDCALYIVRQVPRPIDLPVNPLSATVQSMSKISELYYYDLAQKKANEGRTERHRKAPKIIMPF